MNKQKYSPKASIAQIPGYEFTSRTVCNEKTCDLTRAETNANNNCNDKKQKHKTQCTDTIPNPTLLPNRNLGKQHTETNIETDKPNVRSQYFQPTQIHAQNAHDDTHNKSNVPTKNAKINL